MELDGSNAQTGKQLTNRASTDPSSVRAATPKRGYDASKESTVDSCHAVLLTCYMTGSTEGKNLGIAGYSHDFVAKLFSQLLSRWGKVVHVPNPKKNLESAAQEARVQGLKPLHLSVLPFQDVCLASSIPNVVMPAWEFPDVPDHGFDGNPQNDWPATADRCDLVLASGPFTEQALRKGGARVPIRIVPVPTPDAYFAVSNWVLGQKVSIDCPAYVFPQATSRSPAMSPIRRGAEHLASLFKGRPPVGSRMALPYQCSLPIDLSGIVYTSVFNPDDGRKNWHDLLTGFLFALGDREDATLVLKLVTKSADAVKKVIDYYQGRDVPHRCKVVVIGDFLTEKQMYQWPKPVLTISRRRKRRAIAFR